MPSRLSRCSFAVARCATLVVTFGLAAHGRALTVPAAVDAFTLANNMGVNCHFGLLSTPYHANRSFLESELVYTGVKHFRDEIMSTTARDLVRTFANTNALRADTIVYTTAAGSEALSTTTGATRLGWVNGESWVKFIEGPNEYNATRGPTAPATWDTELAAYQHWLDTNTTKPVIQSPVGLNQINGATVNGQPVDSYDCNTYDDALGASAGAQWGCVHVYGSYDTWRTAYLWTSAATPFLGQINSLRPNAPRITTETGWAAGGSDGTVGSYGNQIDEEVQAKYIARAFGELLEMRADGYAERLYLYQMADHLSPASSPGYVMGLLRYPSSSTTDRKKAFYAFRNMMWHAGSNAKTPTNVTITTSGDPANLKARHIHRSDNTHVVFLWRDIRLWNWPGAGGNKIADPDSNITVTISGHNSKPVHIYRPTGSGYNQTENFSTRNVPVTQTTTNASGQVTVPVNGGMTVLTFYYNSTTPPPIRYQAYNFTAQ